MTSKNSKEKSIDATELLNDAEVLDTFDFDFSDQECEHDVGQQWPEGWDLNADSPQPQSTTNEKNKLKPASMSEPAPTNAIGESPHALWDADGNDQFWDVEVEAKLTSQEAISDIQPNDVLFGRSSQARRHVGNKYFRDLVRSHEEQYRSAMKREDKGLIIKTIVSTIHNRGGRFLKKATRNNSSDAWTVVDSADAHDKVSHTLRNLRLWGNNQSHNSPPTSPIPKAKPAAQPSAEIASKPHLNFEASLLGIVGRQPKSAKLSRGSSFPDQAESEQGVKPKSAPSNSHFS